MPSKKYLHISFWLAHILISIFLFAGSPLSIAFPLPFDIDIKYFISILIIGCASLIWYFFAIGNYANKLGRSGIAWGLFAFIFIPVGIWGSLPIEYFAIGVWLTYISSFFVGSKIEKFES